MENEIMQIIVYAGNARSLAIRSIREAKKGQSLDAITMMTEAQKNLKEAHHAHAKILSASTNEVSPVTLNLFMVHGEDHLMSAITTIDLAKEFLAVFEGFQSLKEEVQLIKEGV